MIHDLTLSSDDEDYFPSLDEVASRPVIKQEKLTPPPRTKPHTAGAESFEGDDQISDDSSIYEVPESDDDDSESEEPATVQESRKRKKGGNHEGPRARTAREYFKRKNAKITPEKRRGSVWKKNKIAELTLRMQKLIIKGNPRKAPSQQRQ